MFNIHVNLNDPEVQKTLLKLGIRALSTFTLGQTGHLFGGHLAHELLVNNVINHTGEKVLDFLSSAGGSWAGEKFGNEIIEIIEKKEEVDTKGEEVDLLVNQLRDNPKLVEFLKTALQQV